MIYEHISEAIKTPHLIHLKENIYLARFECMKIYSTISAVRILLEKGVINRSQTLIDSSSGIYAFALAMACHRYKLKCHIIASKTIDASMQAQLTLLGAIVEPVESAPTLKLDQMARVEKIKKILAVKKNYYWMQQYHDDVHYLGYRDFAQLVKDNLSNHTEILSEITLVGGLGSGCSTGATKNYLEELGTKTTLIGIQPFGSVTFNAEHTDDPGMIIAGIGSSIEFKNVRHASYDYIHWMSFEYAKYATKSLMKEHAIFSGLSSGASYQTALFHAHKNPNVPHVIIAPDLGYRYSKAVFEEPTEIKELTSPKLITQLSELDLPWSYMHQPAKAIQE